MRRELGLWLLAGGGSKANIVSGLKLGSCDKEPNVGLVRQIVVGVCESDFLHGTRQNKGTVGQLRCLCSLQGGAWTSRNSAFVKICTYEHGPALIQVTVLSPSPKDCLKAQEPAQALFESVVSPTSAICLDQLAVMAQSMHNAAVDFLLDKNFGTCGGTIHP